MKGTAGTVVLPFAIVTAIWGSTWIVIRDQLGTVPPSWSVAYRFAVAGLVMLGVALWRRDPLRMDARGWGFASVLAAAQFCCNFNFVYRAEAYVTSGLVAVVFALLVVPNAILARLFLSQRLSARFVGGSAIAVTGVALLFTHEARVDPGNTGAVLTGIGWTLAGVGAASIANVMQASETSRRYPMATMLATAMLLGATLDALVAYTLTGAPVMDWRPGYLAGVLYLGVFASAVAFTLYFGVIRAIGPAKAAYSGVLVPVIAMLISTAVEGYRWSGLAVAGAGLALAGLAVALSARSPAR